MSNLTSHWIIIKLIKILKRLCPTYLESEEIIWMNNLLYNVSTVKWDNTHTILKKAPQLLNKRFHIDS